MSEPWYKIDHAVCNPLDLWDREAMVYNALLYLCKNGPYTGSATDLRLFCRIKSKSTTLRMLSSLEEKDLISRTADGIILNQYGSQLVHNGAGSNHSGAISKEEKENQKKKENIKKDNEVSVSVTRARNTPTSASPQDLIFNNLFHMQPIIPGDKPAIPANTGYYRIIVTEFGFMNPKRYVDEMYLYYNAHNWPQGNKLDVMRWWMRQEMKLHPKNKPNLNDTERAVMRTFLDHIEERLIVRLLHIVRQFEVTDSIIYFYVPESNVSDFVTWLNTLPLKQWFEAYKRTVSVRCLKQ